MHGKVQSNICIIYQFMEKIINVKVIVADRPYRLKIAPEEEEYVRKSAKYIKQKMSELQNAYGAKDKQDYLAMASLLICVDWLKSKNNVQLEDHEIKDKLGRLDQLLNEFLSNKNDLAEVPNTQSKQ